MASSNYLSLRLIHEGNPALSRLGTDRGIRFEPLPLLTSIKHAFQEFTFKAEYAYDSGMPHWLARVDNAFEPFHLERMFLGRHKFYHFRLWYRDQLAGFVKDILLDERARSRPYLDGRRLEEFVNGHISGRRNYTMSIHRLLTAELIQRHLIASQ
jgi:asparagine synthase (glutamine-hydrolysing)